MTYLTTRIAGLSGQRVAIFALILSAFAILSGCKTEGTTEPIPSGPRDSNAVILPLKVGNRWIYKTTDYDSTGTPLRSRGDTTTIVRDTMIGSEKWFIDQGGVVQTNRTTGLHLMDQTGETYLVNAYPATLNQTYRIYGAYGVTVKVMSLNQSVATTAGTFTCVVYEWRLTSTGNKLSSLSYSPNVGLAKLETFLLRSDGQVYLGTAKELISVSLVN
jgi:hypothetical protein